MWNFVMKKFSLRTHFGLLQVTKVFVGDSPLPLLVHVVSGFPMIDRLFDCRTAVKFRVMKR